MTMYLLSFDISNVSKDLSYEYLNRTVNEFISSADSKRVTETLWYVNTNDDAGEIRDKVLETFDGHKNRIRESGAEITICVHMVVSGHWATYNLGRVGEWMLEMDEQFESQDSQAKKVAYS